MTMQRWMTAIATIWMALASPALSGDRVVVVELYTSQGCSSCPPADALMRELADRDDLIALSLHVDYWDYIGWQDSFAQPRHSKRQRSYALAMGEKMVYTPQIIVDGHTALIGSNTAGVRDAIKAAQTQDHVIDLEAEREGSVLTVSARATEAAGPVDVFVVQYIPEATVTIERGENAGKTILYANTVTDWRYFGTWNGRSDLSLMVPVDGDMPVAIVMQAQGFGPVLAAARFD